MVAVPVDLASLIVAVGVWLAVVDTAIVAAGVVWLIPVVRGMVVASVWALVPEVKSSRQSGTTYLCLTTLPPPGHFPIIIHSYF